MRMVEEVLLKSSLCAHSFYIPSMMPRLLTLIRPQGDYEPLSSALSKLLLDDAGVSVRKDTSVALGAGWRLGENAVL